jgi:hypothetical protein
MDRVPRHLAMALLCVLASCATSHQTAIDGTVDGGVDVGAPDSPMGVDTCPPRTTVRWYDQGYCFESPSCCVDLDCGAGFACSERGRCVQLGRPCSCITGDCGIGRVCLTNEVWCGVCELERPRCSPSTPCPTSTDVCESGYCVDTTAACELLMFERL